MSLTPSQLHRVTLTLVNLAADAQEATQARLTADKSRMSSRERVLHARYQGALDIVSMEVDSFRHGDVGEVLAELGPRPHDLLAARTWTAQVVSSLVERWS